MIFAPEDHNSQNHACTLNTISNIESFIYENSGVYSKTELWNNLPKKIMYQSYKVVLEYLLHQGKIAVLNRKVVWTNKGNLLNLDSFEAQNHNATLSTIVSIERFLSSNSGVFSKTELWNALPKKIMYQTYKVVLEYLFSSGNYSVIGKKVVKVGGDAL